jgi:molecular chaperone GrpE
MADGDDPKDQGPAAPGSDGGARSSTLEADLATAREEARQAHDRWVRTVADLENLKKRAARERADTIRFANENFARDLLPVVDNLERAAEHARGGGNGKPLVEGVELVLKSLLDVLERHGVTRVAAAGGAPFDPTHHEAVAHVESAEHEPNSVMAEHQPGYRLNERLLRPALVTVAKAPSDPNPNLAKGRGRD